MPRLPPRPPAHEQRLEQPVRRGPVAGVFVQPDHQPARSAVVGVFGMLRPHVVEPLRDVGAVEFARPIVLHVLLPVHRRARQFAPVGLDLAGEGHAELAQAGLDGAGGRRRPAFALDANVEDRVLPGRTFELFRFMAAFPSVQRAGGAPGMGIADTHDLGNVAPVALRIAGAGRGDPRGIELAVVLSGRFIAAQCEPGDPSEVAAEVTRSFQRRRPVVRREAKHRKPEIERARGRAPAFKPLHPDERIDKPAGVRRGRQDLPRLPRLDTARHAVDQRDEGNEHILARVIARVPFGLDAGTARRPGQQQGAHRFAEAGIRDRERIGARPALLDPVD